MLSEWATRHERNSSNRKPVSSGESEAILEQAHAGALPAWRQARLTSILRRDNPYLASRGRSLLWAPERLGITRDWSGGVQALKA